MKKQSNRVLDEKGNFVPFPVEQVKTDIETGKVDGAVLQDHIDALKEPEPRLKNAPKKNHSYHEQMKEKKKANIKEALIQTYSHDAD